MWGAGPVRSRAADTNLAPFYGWSEAATGTNGMGTALRQAAAISVHGPEHWCEALHEWSCVATAVYDPVTHEAIAALNVSTWAGVTPVSPPGLEAAIDAVRRGLRAQAMVDTTEITREFAEVDRRSRGAAVLALDAAGGVVEANDAARALLADLPDRAELEPGSRWREVRELRETASRAIRYAAREPGWVGAVDLGPVLDGDERLFEVRPVVSGNGAVGLIFAADPAPGGERLLLDPAVPAAPAFPRRVVGVRDGRALLLSPTEIRYAEADRHDVWLVTDLGRVRALTRGMDKLERELAPLGFVRTHRSYLVNMSRIREVGQHGKGGLTLSTQPHKPEMIPVSRRCADRLRHQLGL